jgi:hypothetical protein
MLHIYAALAGKTGPLERARSRHGRQSILAFLLRGLGSRAKAQIRPPMHSARPLWQGLEHVRAFC